jgi:hypothetical protein
LELTGAGGWGSSQQERASQVESYRRKKNFVHQVARSVTEIQSNVNNLADVLVFIEVLGYRINTVREHGFSDMRELSRYVYEEIDYFDVRDPKATRSKPLLMPVPGMARRVLEGLALSAPWLMTFPLIFLLGVSLWIDWLLPMPVMTAMALGTIVGLMVSEGPVWTFSRLFLFYHSQTNVSETRRLFKRNYLLFAAILALVVASFFILSSFMSVPLELAGIATAAAVTMAVHRFTFSVIFILKKLAISVVTYGAAFASLLSVYYLLPGVFSDPTTRYLASLGTAFAVLCIPATYYTKKVIALSPTARSADAPSFFNPRFINKETLRSKFRVQLWENLPYFLYGTLFVIVLFGDRILSWIFNPSKNTGGSSLPLLFNPVYHMGADLALFVLFPSGLIVYLLTGRIFEELHNVSLESGSAEQEKVDEFIRCRYMKTLLVCLLVSVSIAICLNILAPQLMHLAGASSISEGILRIASVANVILSIFVVNSVFMMLLNKAKLLVLVVGLSALILGVGGWILGALAFNYIVWAYFASCLSASTLSTVEVRKLFGMAGSRFLARF